MKKVLLINPPVKKYEGAAGFEIHFPIGLLYVAAKVKKVCNLKLLDCLVTDFEIRKEEE